MLKELAFVLGLVAVLAGTVLNFPKGKSASILVETPLGPVQGYESISQDGKKFFSFEGIPFAEPPVGELRFEKPVPIKPWTDVLQAHYHPECTQFHLGYKKIYGQEDCLYLSVYTPEVSKEKQKLKPVYVWIHGGGFITGSGSKDLYGAERFVDHDIVIVSINYRLGPLGFLTTGDEVMPGNQGLWDQVEALKWVQKNVKSFGGDPNQVTIGGESAGSMSVMALYFSKEAKGLFHRAIAQSGVLSSVFLHKEKHPSFYSRQLGHKFGCGVSSKDSAQLKSCLKKVSNLELVEDLKTMGLSSAGIHYKPIPYIATIDDYSSRPFLPEDPYLALQNPDTLEVNDVPLLIGNNKDEGRLFMKEYLKNPEEVTKESIALQDQLGPLMIMGLEADESNAEDVKDWQQIGHHYLGPDLSKSRHDHFYAMTNMLTDAWFLMPGMVTTRELVKHVKSPIYEYLYAHHGSLTLCDVLSFKLYHFLFKMIAQLVGTDLYTEGDYVCHSDELFVLFKANAIPLDATFTEDDKGVSREMVTFWTNFIKTGNPTPTEVNGVTWNKMKADESSQWLKGCFL